ncbi:hypothetical protein M8C21_018167, partial [Ambrosia artemisiifolia]
WFDDDGGGFKGRSAVAFRVTRKATAGLAIKVPVMNQGSSRTKCTSLKDLEQGSIMVSNGGESDGS